MNESTSRIKSDVLETDKIVQTRAQTYLLLCIVAFGGMFTGVAELELPFGKEPLFEESFEASYRKPTRPIVKDDAVLAPVITATDPGARTRLARLFGGAPNSESTNEQRVASVCVQLALAAVPTTAAESRDRHSILPVCQ